MWVVQVDFDFFGSCAGGIPLLLPRDGPVLPWRTLHPTVWPLQPCCILQWGASPSLITTPAWGRETAHPRGPNNCCYRQTRDRGHHQHLPHTTGLKKVHKPSNQLWATVQRLPIFFFYRFFTNHRSRPGKFNFDFFLRISKWDLDPWVVLSSVIDFSPLCVFKCLHKCLRMRSWPGRMVWCGHEAAGRDHCHPWLTGKPNSQVH